VGVEVLIGEDSTVVDAEDRMRLAGIAAAQPTRVHVHLVHGAGHWVHVDQPDTTVALLAEAFRADATA
jgi:pimeloyl-ACP methyl ester carboxylesterase